jgi:1-acyl-sn-glycerol-3-phosphate acyltransferase
LTTFGAWVVEAGRIASTWVLLRTVAATLKITLATLYEAHRGTHRRETVDERLRWWSTHVLDMARISYRAVNPDNVSITPGRPIVLMSNHSSLYDIPLIFATIDGSIRMLTKEELFRTPIWGRGMRSAEFISIDRHNHDRALADLEVAKDKMRSGIALWLAPEGTRSKTAALEPFKKGGFMLALQTGATIIPIGIRGAREALPPKTFALRYDTHAEVHIGRPIETSDYDEGSRGDLMARVRAEIARLADTDGSLPAPTRRLTSPARLKA